MLPRYLTKNRDGRRPWEPPAKCRAAFQCTVCRAYLVRGETLWVCPKGLHSKALTDRQLTGLVYDALYFGLQPGSPAYERLRSRASNRAARYVYLARRLSHWQGLAACQPQRFEAATFGHYAHRKQEPS